MSVLVTTTFSQGAVFYAGETLSCTIAFTNPIHNNTNNAYPSKPIKPSVPAPVLSTFSQQHRKNTRSISSLASSTLAFLTRTSTPMTEDEQPVIPIELDSPTPRSSIDTFVQHQPSPRSSIDSNTSFRSRRYSNSPLKRPTSEHLMCGFAQQPQLTPEQKAMLRQRTVATISNFALVVLAVRAAPFAIEQVKKLF
ncbi:hypothetical protein A0J61_00849 [Choanephora cucurbitarum]|uniref:Uncharacterized protein n=1 Tax=Choanephora cucurbitarum TaxID=101091 RepID=A0A1C7NPQ8_9FUNG|nr:hypothetical protein A0J61_00849 [Choanephora cucurbitarum]